MKAYVYVSLKKSVLDPQGKPFRVLKYDGLQGVRTFASKHFELTLDGQLSKPYAESEVERIARVPTNPVIEEYRYSLGD
jgi:phosphoribosylformylglycinamidine synthase PurS subunit